jgi:hypothetical protein
MSASVLARGDSVVLVTISTSRGECKHAHIMCLTTHFLTKGLKMKSRYRATRAAEKPRLTA